jgi:DNA-binding response OmpR family regulator
MATILLVEDDATLLATIAYNLRRENHDVLTASDGHAALQDATDAVDVVILDVMLPGVDGFEVCRQIRLRSAVPILMLTAKADEIDRVVGLELGADDYLTKPFSMRELVARVKALLRRRDLLATELTRKMSNDDHQRLFAGDLTIDVAGHRVTLNMEDVELTPKEFELLTFLVRHRGQVFSAERLVASVWTDDYQPDPRTIPVHIRSLRQKIEDEPSQPRHIQTVRGVGYRFAN